MTAFDDAVERVQIAIRAAKADGSLKAVDWSVNTRGDDVMHIDVRDCQSYAAICDQLGAKNDGGQWSNAANHRIYDALTKDNKLVIEHRCWPHLDCWEKS